MQESASTIVACATGKTRAGVSIVRISGNLAFQVTEKVTLKPIPLARVATNRKFFTREKTLIDKGLILCFPAPHSYTGEDVVELHTHGSPFIVETLIKEVIAHGGEQAKPGEFSERAFLSGKMDLLQAEAVCDLIQAQTQQQARAACASLQGVFSKRVHACANELEVIRIQLEASIDFADQDPETSSWYIILDKLNSLITDLEKLIHDAQRGVHTQAGIHVVLVGRPNVGKSSLLNRLTQSDTAIVTDTPGTTRDTIEATISHHGQLIRVTDTAGLRKESMDPIEAIGMEKTRKVLEHADCIWLLVDCRDSNKSIQNTLDELIPEIHKPKCSVVANKIDLIEKELNAEMAAISAETGAGIDQLLHETLTQCDLSESVSFSARARHIEALENMHEKLMSAKAHQQHEPELIAENLRYAQEDLGKILGTYYPDDLLDAIFRSFCLGK